MRKEDLKDGMIVQYRDGNLRVVEGDKILGEHGFNYLRCYNDELINIMGSCRDIDIVAVYEPVWQREEVVEMTMEEINKALGKTVKVVE